MFVESVLVSEDILRFVMDPVSGVLHCMNGGLFAPSLVDPIHRILVCGIHQDILLRLYTLIDMHGIPTHVSPSSCCTIGFGIHMYKSLIL